MPSALAVAGALDPSFGSGGKVLTGAEGANGAYAVAVQADGKIVVGGKVIARYNRDGTLDSTFGTGGIALLGVHQLGYDLVVARLVLEPDGKIIAAGPLGFSTSSAIARYNADGTLDASFGSNGRVLVFGSIASVMLERDRKVVVDGTIAGRGCFVARYDPLGRLDPSFGTAGRVVTRHGLCTSAVLQPDGKIVAAGESNGKFLLLRYTASGKLDTTLGSGGRVVTGFSYRGSFAAALTVYPGGKIVVAGWAEIGSSSDFALARYTSTGKLDATFGSRGRVLTDFGSQDSAAAVISQPDGKIVAVGYAYSPPHPPRHQAFALARYRADGTLDATFGAGGKTVTTFANNRDPFDNNCAAIALAIQRDGKIIAAGWSYLPRTTVNSTATGFAIARYEAS